MRRLALPRLTGAVAGWLAAAVCVSVAVVIGIGYRAEQERRQSEELLAARRAREAVDLLATALSRDMHAVQNAVLPAWWEDMALDPSDDVRDLVASAFARYPYPESFFAWKADAADPSMTFFNRSDRPPSWSQPVAETNPFPVVIGRAPEVSRALLDRIRADGAAERRFSVFEVPLDGARYQVVARLYYGDAFRERLAGIVGFTVNVEWARLHYFPEIAREVAAIGNALPVAIVDARGRLVAGSATPGRDSPIVRRWFPVTFFDPLAAGVDPTADAVYQSWAVQAAVSDDTTLRATAKAGSRTLFAAAVAAVVLVAGLLLTARAASANERVAGMRSDFVSTVTHELKTPIATIRAIGETLVRGRVAEPAAQREYAEMVVQEAKRLTRLVDNLLAYARITDVTEVYAFEPIDLGAAAAAALESFGSQLGEAGFEVHVECPPDLPAARADRTALRLVLENLLDNAIRYSGDGRWLGVRARRAGEARVRLEVADRGVGIPPDEIGQVTRRFYRGRRSPSGGSGLGLAIVRRIVADHGGELSIESEPGTGTTVGVTLPVAE
jgi:signal transduction histidine kinase